MVLEALASGLVALGVVWLVIQPLVAPATDSLPIVDPPEPEETARGRALLALKEIEFDRATGKLSDEDYQALHGKYQRAAIATLEGCAKCGAPMATDDEYCGMCGARR